MSGSLGHFAITIGHVAESYARVFVVGDAVYMDGAQMEAHLTAESRECLAPFRGLSGVVTRVFRRPALPPMCEADFGSDLTISAPMALFRSAYSDA